MNRNNLRYGVPPLVAVALAVAVMAAIALPVTLAAQAPEHRGTVVASATVHAGGVDFRPEVGHAGGVVTVSGNGLAFQRAIEAGASASIGVFDPEGQLLPDGVYGWELQLYPDARTAKKLRAAAKLNGGRAPEAWLPQTGTFAIANGLVAAADLAEPGPAPRPASAGSALPLDLAGPSAARGPALDDDAAVGSRKDAEAEMRAVLASQPQAAPAGRTVSERTDAAALATGASPEPSLARDDASPEAQPAREFMLHDSTNGRDRSDQR